MIKRSCFSGYAVALVLSGVSPAPAVAQLPVLEGLFKHVTDVNLFGVLGWFAHRPPALAGSLDNGEPRSGGLTGLGFEVSFSVAQDTVKGGSPWSVELALGYTEIQDFVSARAGLDVRGAIRELPAVSLYLNHEDDCPIGFYGGVRTGLAHLQGFRAYVGDSSDNVVDAIYKGGGTTFEFGIVAGALAQIGPVTLFVEPGYTQRRFSGVEWEGSGGTISDLVPRSLNMSTFAISIGTQLGIGAAKN